MTWSIYLSGEIHTDWRDQIAAGAKSAGLDVVLTSPVTHHEASDDCGVAILGSEANKFWHDHKGAQINAIRTRTLIEDADVVVVRFGEKYKQWNAAFDAGYAAALGKPIIIMHQDEHAHALKEVDAAALAVTKTPDQVVAILSYVIEGKLAGYTDQAQAAEWGGSAEMVGAAIAPTLDELTTAEPTGTAASRGAPAPPRASACIRVRA